MARTALLSVFHKEGIVDFARQLHVMGWNLLASGGTAKAITEAGIPVRDVADLVGGDAILGHRVVTLSRQVHAGLLAQYIEADLRELEALGIPTIDLVCVDLYPLVAEVANPAATRASVIEKTDIGGPTMLRSGAKGRRIVVCKPDQRQDVIDWLKKGEPNREEFLNDLAAEAEFLVGIYCLVSADYHSNGKLTGFIGRQVVVCKGENGWQVPAGLYSSESADPLALDKFKLAAGSNPSYNNFADLDRGLQTITHIAAAFDLNRCEVPCIALGIKHGNACGAAAKDTPKEALEAMIDGDRIALFGGTVMVNFHIGLDEAATLRDYGMEPNEKRLLDTIIAPSFSEVGIDYLRRRGDRCRMLDNSALANLDRTSLDAASRFRYARGGFLKQPNYTFVLDMKSSGIVKIGNVWNAVEDDMLLAWAVGSTSNSNTITIVRDRKLLANAVGQQDRVGAVQLALWRAERSGNSVVDAVVYSDSFFPETDGPAVLVEANIGAILTSSGSIRDEAVITFCKEQRGGLILYLIEDAKGRGFFGH